MIQLSLLIRSKCFKIKLQPPPIIIFSELHFSTIPARQNPIPFPTGINDSQLIIDPATGIPATDLTKIYFIWYKEQISLLALFDNLSGAVVHFIVFGLQRN